MGGVDRRALDDPQPRRVRLVGLIEQARLFDVEHRRRRLARHHDLKLLVAGPGDRGQRGRCKRGNERLSGYVRDTFGNPAILSQGKLGAILHRHFVPVSSEFHPNSIMNKNVENLEMINPMLVEGTFQLQY